MAPSIPSPFSDLITTANKATGTFVNIMGVITDSQQPTMSKGSDWTCNFCLADWTYGRLGMTGDEGLRVRCFGPTMNDLPVIGGTGDVAILRDVKVSKWQGMTNILTNRASKWAVLPQASIPKGANTPGIAKIPHRKQSTAPLPTNAEMLYAIELCNLNERSLYTSTETDLAPMSQLSGAVIRTAPPKEKFSWVRDLDIERFYDLTGQVIRTHTTSDRLEVYLTDYTGNRLLWQYNEEDGTGYQGGDDYGYLEGRSKKPKWRGPRDKLTLTVTLFPPHSFAASEWIKDDDFIRLQNVHIKFSKDAKMEGALHTDQKYPDKVLITKVHENDYEDDERVKDILRRKRDYWKKRKKPDEASDEEQPRGLKRKHVEDKKPLSKRDKKKRKKEATAAATAARVAQANERRNGTPTKPHPEQTNGHILPSKDLNPNIRCSHPHIPPRPLSAITSTDSPTHSNTTPDGNAYTFPFANINSRATVRIVDFFPQNLEDFSIHIPKKKSEYDILSDASSSSSEDSEESNSNSEDEDEDSEGTYEWRFALILEDASNPKQVKLGEKERIEVFCIGADAEYLLKLDACNLRKDKERLAELREKLFLLWGDLEEGKRRADEDAEARGRVDGDGEVEGQAITGANESRGVMGKGAGVGDGEVKSRPFQCCLKEYGVKVRKKREKSELDGDADVEMEAEEEEEPWIWERRWRLWGCTVV